MDLFCPNCKNQLQEGSRFCSNCGNPVYTEPAKNDYPLNNQVGNTQLNQNQSQLTFWKIFSRFWSCSFKGRCSCEEMWLTYFCNLGFYFIICVLGSFLDHLFNCRGLMIATIVLLITFASLIPNLAISCRRVHDLNLSGYWILTTLIPYINILFILYFLFCPGTKGDNNYGSQCIYNPASINIQQGQNQGNPIVINDNFTNENDEYWIKKTDKNKKGMYFQTLRRGVFAVILIIGCFIAIPYFTYWKSKENNATLIEPETKTEAKTKQNEKIPASQIKELKHNVKVTFIGSNGIKFTKQVPLYSFTINTINKEDKITSIVANGEIAKQLIDDLQDFYKDKYIINKSLTLKNFEKSIQVSISSKNLAQLYVETVFKPIQKIIPNVTKGHVTAKSGVNVRKEPNTKAPKIGDGFALNTVVTIIDGNGPKETIEDIESRWYKVTNGEDTGWCFGGFIEIDE